MASTDVDSPLETPKRAAASSSLKGGSDHLFGNDGTIGDLFGDNEEEEGLFVEDDSKENAGLDYEKTVIVDSDFCPVKSAVKKRIKDAQLETKRAPVMKKGRARKVTKPVAKPSSYWVSKTKSDEEDHPFAAFKKRKTSEREKKKKKKSRRKHARDSSSEEQDEETDDSLCESFDENQRGKDDIKADSLADRIKRSRRHARAIRSKEKVILEVGDYKLSQKEKDQDNAINEGHDHARHSTRNDDSKGNYSTVKAHPSTAANTVVNQPVIVFSELSSPEKRERGAPERHLPVRKSSGPNSKRTRTTISTKGNETTRSIPASKGGETQQAAGTSKQPFGKAASATNAMIAEQEEGIKTKPKRCMFVTPAFRSRLPAQKANKTTPASKALSPLKLTTRVRKDSGVDMSPTTVNIPTGTEHASRDHIEMFEKQSGKHTRNLAGPGQMITAVGDAAVIALRYVSPARSDVCIDWTSEERAALGVSPHRKPILSPKRMKAVSLNSPGEYKFQSLEAASGIQSLVDSESAVPTVPSLSENKSTSEAESWIETPGHTSEDGTSANSLSAQDGPSTNPQSALTTEDAHAAVILAHLAYRGVLGHRERAGIIEHEAVQGIVMPRRWVFTNGVLDGITDSTPSNQILIILESEVALIEAQYNSQRSRSQQFTAAHAIFWNQVLLPIKRFLSNYRTANIVITRSNAETILLALSREEIVSHFDIIVQKNFQDSNREVIAAMGLLAMRKRV